MKSNFNTLKKIDTKLAEIAMSSEKLFLHDYAACVARIGVFAEIMTEKILFNENISHDDIEIDQYNRINYLKEKTDVDEYVIDALHEIRMSRNKVEHGEKTLRTSNNEALHFLKIEFNLANWFIKRYYNVENSDKFWIPKEGESEVVEDELHLKQNSEEINKNIKSSQKKTKSYLGIKLILVLVIIIEIIVICSMI